VSNYLTLARDAAVESYGHLAVGEFSHTLQENQDSVISYLFGCKLKGYPDWFISVTLFVDGWDATVSEVALAPSETSLIAPNWTPWSERLADYKALQAALEAEAEAAAALAEEIGESEDDDTDEVDEADDEFDASFEGESSEGEGVAAKPETGEEPVALAVADVPETPEAEDDSNAAGGKGQGLFKWKTLRGKKKHK